ncbi:leucine Rich Repeat [Seminavis robusta]|uniref:Leucine Rich Repeat n=1 Tax=Seminavis robusta TaxID=568900 RepID=A0A9N8DIS9_9STRA|nr:leucine Rich Repeat [Seminavis robusta]|eukprot:Sro166_g074290.1 leucine Rich Repeat (948) ;mRNA; r:95440-98619
MARLKTTPGRPEEHDEEEQWMQDVLTKRAEAAAGQYPLDEPASVETTVAQTARVEKPLTSSSSSGTAGEIQTAAQQKQAKQKPPASSSATTGIKTAPRHKQAKHNPPASSSATTGIKTSAARRRPARPAKSASLPSATGIKQNGRQKPTGKSRTAVRGPGYYHGNQNLGTSQHNDDAEIMNIVAERASVATAESLKDSDRKEDYYRSQEKEDENECNPAAEEEEEDEDEDGEPVLQTAACQATTQPLHQQGRPGAYMGAPGDSLHRTTTLDYRHLRAPRGDSDELLETGSAGGLESLESFRNNGNDNTLSNHSGKDSSRNLEDVPLLEATLVTDDDSAKGHPESKHRSRLCLGILALLVIMVISVTGIVCGSGLCSPKKEDSNVQTTTMEASNIFKHNTATVQIFSQPIVITQTVLVLSDQDLGGPIPTEIAELTQLTELLLDGNSLTGPIPPELGTLTHLTVLDLRNNQLSGTVPSNVSELTQLSELRLDNNSLTGTIPPELGELTQLTIMDLTKNELTGTVPQSVCSLTQDYSLSYVAVDDGVICPRKDCTCSPGDANSAILAQPFDSPTFASVAPSFVPSLRPLTTETGMPSLVPTGMPTGMPSSSATSGTPSYTPSILPTSIPTPSPSAWPSGSPSAWPTDRPSPAPSAAPSETPSTAPSTAPSETPSTLPSEILSTAPTTGGTMEGTSEGTTEGATVSTVVVAGQEYSLSATVMFVSSTFSGSLPTEIGLLTGLHGISFNSIGEHVNNLYGTLPTELGLLTSLITLDLSYSWFSGTLPTELGRLTRLSNLQLTSNSLTGSIPTELGQMTACTSMELNLNRLSGPLPTELGRLTLLNSLVLTSNSLTGSIPTELGQMTACTSMELKLNGLTGEVPQSVCSLTLDYDLGFAGVDSAVECPASCCCYMYDRCCKEAIESRRGFSGESSGEHTQCSPESGLNGTRR